MRVPTIFFAAPVLLNVGSALAHGESLQLLLFPYWGLLIVFFLHILFGRRTKVFGKGWWVAAFVAAFLAPFLPLLLGAQNGIPLLLALAPSVWLAYVLAPCVKQNEIANSGASRDAGETREQQSET